MFAEVARVVTLLGILSSGGTGVLLDPHGETVLIPVSLLISGPGIAPLKDNLKVPSWYTAPKRGEMTWHRNK